MAFDQSTITEVKVDSTGPDLFVSWRSTRPSGSWSQVYVNGVLSWSGQSSFCQVPRSAVPASSTTWVEVAGVDPSEIHQNFSASLSSTAQSGHARLSWEGGTYLDSRGNDDVSAFEITSSRAPGALNDPTNVLTKIAAYPGGWISDGFGLGGFGRGGFGRSATVYQWTSPPLASGVWQFSVVPIDRQGNAKASARVISLSAVSVPLAPAAPASGPRLAYQPYNPGPLRFNLSWLASPSDNRTQ